MSCILRAHNLFGWYELIKTNFKIGLWKCVSDFKDLPFPFKRVSEIIHFTRVVIEKYIFLVKQKKILSKLIFYLKINFLAAEYRSIKKTRHLKTFS